GLARQLRRRGQRTVQYVAPTVWAWRPGRAASVARATNLLLALFPFEPALFRAHGLASHFVGHPLADEIAASPELLERRRRGASARPGRLALLPGSRRGEIQRHAALLGETARWLRSQRPELELTM